jgi:hypothetical protein
LWHRTDAGTAVLEDTIVVPSGPFLPHVVPDFAQAFAEARLGMFGPRLRAGRRQASRPALRHTSSRVHTTSDGVGG